MENIHKKLKEKIRNHNLYKKTIENRYIVIFLLILVILMTYSYLSEGLMYNISSLDLGNITKFINSFGKMSWLLYLITTILIAIFPVPSAILNLAGSISFGPLNAILLTLTGTLIGNSIDYLVAKRYGYEYVKHLITDKKREKFEESSKKYGPFVLFILRLNPITSTDLFSYLSGLIGMPFRKFLVSTFFGVLPGIVFVSYFGSEFINGNRLFKILFLIVTIFYMTVLTYMILRFLKNKVKGKFIRN